MPPLFSPCLFILSSLVQLHRFSAGYLFFIFLLYVPSPLFLPLLFSTSPRSCFLVLKYFLALIILPSPSFSLPSFTYIFSRLFSKSLCIFLPHLSSIILFPFHHSLTCFLSLFLYTFTLLALIILFPATPFYFSFHLFPSPYLLPCLHHSPLTFLLSLPLLTDLSSQMVTNSLYTYFTHSLFLLLFSADNPLSHLTLETVCTYD